MGATPEPLSQARSPLEEAQGHLPRDREWGGG